MDERTSQNLVEALANAVRHRLKEEKPNDIVKSAQKYFEFLQGNEAASDIEIARICHEANRAYCQSIGDDSQPTWADAPDWQKDSAINGVEFHRSDPNAKAYASHESWMAEKVADGWKYGDTKDPELKTHPCMVRFEDLPMEQQLKDHIFRSIVHAMAAI